MHRRAWIASLAGGLLLASMAPPVAAVDPIPGRPIPDEPPVTQLKDLVSASLVADLDRDGTREVVAIATLDELRGFAAVQAWWVEDDGSVVASNQVRLRRSATFDDRVAIGNGIRIDEDGMTGVRLGEPAHLLTVRRDGREVVLATGIGDNPELTQACCLTIWEVTSARRGDIGLQLVAELHSWADELVVADLDADGTDELLLEEPNLDPDASPGPGATVLLAWDGSTYEITRSVILGDGWFLDAGDSDGVAGDDILAMEWRPEEERVRLVRLSMRGGVIVREDDPDQGFEAQSGRVLSLPAGPTIMASDGAFMSLVRWERDSALELESTPNRNVVPLAVLGSGANTLVVGGTAFAELSALHVYRAADGGWITFGADLRASLLAAAVNGVTAPPTATWTYEGPIRGGVPGAAEAFAFSGMIAVPTPGGPDGVRVEPMALLPGRSITGTAGPGGAWAVLSHTPPADVQQSPRVTTVGSLRESGALDLAATASILEPESADGALEPTFLGVAPDPEGPDRLMVGREAVDAEIQAPPGSLVWWSARRPGGIDTLLVGADGTARLRLLEPAGDEVEDGKSVVRRIWLVTPAGHFYSGSWIIRVFRAPPNLGIDEVGPLLDLAPVLAGRTLAGSSVTVNGQPVTLSADGSFSVAVDVGILPTEIRVVVTDPVGNQTERLITRVWPLDYRQLPWVPIVVFILLTVAGLLYVYEPDSRPRRRSPQDEEATFEEIGG
jgi:hypothetical protein